MSGYRFFLRLTQQLLTVAGVGCIIIGCLQHAEDPEYTDELYNLRLTEINYNPAACGTVPGDSLEYIELKNTGSTTLELGTLEFVAGIDYVFPVSVTLAPGKFFCIASNSNKFSSCYGIDADAGYKGLLRNSVDTVKLIHPATGKVIIFQYYADSGIWPKPADGGGYSLVPVVNNPAANATGPDNWRSSTNLKGSPGADDVAKVFDSTLFNLKITEINYHPSNPSDTLGEDSLEFIELKNTGSQPITLTDVEFIAGVNYQFAAGTILAANAFLVLASNASWFEGRYGYAPFDVYDGQLRNSGETIVIKEVKAGVTIVSVTYSDGNPWPSKADGDGWSLVTLQDNPGRHEQDNPASWRASFRVKGSPGKNDPGVVLINEVLPHTDLPNVDAIELYNPGAVSVDIGGWFLSDHATDPLKFRIPDGTKVAAGGYRVFTADDFNKDSTAPGAFALSELGDEASIVSDSTGCKGYCHGYAFGVMANGISYGRYIVPSTGNEVFVPMRNTLGFKNSEPIIGPLVISEILCQPMAGKPGFVEITNIGTVEFPLYDPDAPEDAWRLRIDDQYFVFPGKSSVGSGESILVGFTKGNTDAFRSAYGVQGDVQVFAFGGMLPDSSAKLELESPVPPERGSNGAIIIYYMQREKISYKSLPPWPTGGNGTGASLTRKVKSGFGNDPANWVLAPASPGKTD